MKKSEALRKAMQTGTITEQSRLEIQDEIGHSTYEELCIFEAALAPGLERERFVWVLFSVMGQPESVDLFMRTTGARMLRVEAQCTFTLQQDALEDDWKMLDDTRAAFSAEKGALLKRVEEAERETTYLRECARSLEVQRSDLRDQLQAAEGQIMNLRDEFALQYVEVTKYSALKRAVKELMA